MIDLVVNKIFLHACELLQFFYFLGKKHFHFLHQDVKKNEFRIVKVEVLRFRMRSSRLLYDFFLQNYNNLKY